MESPCFFPALAPPRRERPPPAGHGDSPPSRPRWCPHGLWLLSGGLHCPRHPLRQPAIHRVRPLPVVEILRQSPRAHLRHPPVPPRKRSPRRSPRRIRKNPLSIPRRTPPPPRHDRNRPARPPRSRPRPRPLSPRPQPPKKTEDKATLETIYSETLTRLAPKPAHPPIPIAHAP